ncbi:hypothetical protein ACROYT_G021762 [Oculina patagonica]
MIFFNDFSNASNDKENFSNDHSNASNDFLSRSNGNLTTNKRFKSFNEKALKYVFPCKVTNSCSEHGVFPTNLRAFEERLMIKDSCLQVSCSFLGDQFSAFWIHNIMLLEHLF